MQKISRQESFLQDTQKEKDNLSPEETKGTNLELSKKPKKALYKIELNKLKERKKLEALQTLKNTSYEIIDDLNKTRTIIHSCEISDDLKDTRTNINYYKTIDVLENTHNLTDYYSSRNNNICKSESTGKIKDAESRNVQNSYTRHSNTQSKEFETPDSGIIDDMKQAHQEYIKSIYNKKSFPFKLFYNLKNLFRIQKWKFQRLIKSEQKSGAKAIGKIANKKNLFPDREAFNKRIHADGKNEEIARNFYEHSKSPQKISQTSQLDSRNSLESP